MKNVASAAKILSDTEVFYLNIAKNAIIEYEKEKEKKEKEAILYNAKMVLEHYNDFRWHCNNAKHDISDDDDAVIIKSIKQSKMACVLLFGFIDTVLRDMRENSKITRVEFRVLELYYIDKKISRVAYGDRVTLICEMLHISNSTFFRHKKRMENEFAAKLFGPFGIKLTKI